MGLFRLLRSTAKFSLRMLWKRPPSDETVCDEEPAHHVPDRLSPAVLERMLPSLLMGAPADGSAGSVESARSVVWVHQGDEVIVHLDSLRMRVEGPVLLASIDLECDQVNRSALVVPLALGQEPDAGIRAVTEELPRGPEVLARRWGPLLQDALYAALLRMGEAHGGERGGYPAAMHLTNGTLAFVSEEEHDGAA